MNTKPRFVDEDSPQYRKLSRALADDLCPSIHPCRDCGGPVAKGLCCTRCGSTNP